MPDDRTAASTRVSDGLISTLGRASARFRRVQHPVTSSPRRQGAPRRNQPDVIRAPHYQTSCDARHGLIRPREHNRGCWQLLLLRAFDAASTPLDAPRQPYLARSKPVGPRMSKNTGVYAQSRTFIPPLHSGHAKPPPTPRAESHRAGCGHLDRHGLGPTGGASACQAAPAIQRPPAGCPAHGCEQLSRGRPYPPFRRGIRVHRDGPERA